MRQTKTNKNAPSSNTRTRGRTQPVRLKIEAMEDRTVPSAVPLLPVTRSFAAHPANDSALLGNTLVFGASTVGGASTALFSTDGTPAHTGPLGGPELAHFTPTEIVSANGRIVFTAKDANVAGDTLNLYSWSATNGIGTNDAPVKLTSFTDHSGAANLATTGGTVYFFHTVNGGTAGNHAIELWASDGTAASTHLVKSFAPEGREVPFIATAEAVGNRLYFRVKSEVSNRVETRLWISDGTLAGTTAIAGPSTTGPQATPNEALVASDQRLYFTATDGTGTTGLYAAVGTTVTNLGGSGVDRLMASGRGTVVFTATGERGTVFGVTDGSAAGTVQVADANQFPATLNRNTIDHVTVARSIVYFTADETNTGNELWMAQGNIVKLVSDLVPGTASSHPEPLLHVGETLYFAATDAAHGRELFATDGTTAGTGLVADFVPGIANSDPSEVAIVNGRALAVAASASGLSPQLYALDGTPGNPTRGTPASASYGIAVSATRTTVTFGEGASLTVTVTPLSGSPAATGRVKIFDGGTSVGSADVGPNGVATWASSSALAPGAHAFSAVLTTGGSNFASAPVTVTVTKLPTTTTLATSASTAAFGSPISFTATVTSRLGVATGTVTFRAGATDLGTVAVSGGNATLAVATLPAGPQSVIATYNGNEVLAPSSASSSVSVGSQPATNTEVYSTASTIGAGQPVTIAAKVREILVGGNLTRTVPTGPSGNVTFRDGTTVLGTVAISSTSGIASMTLSNLSGGVHNITASYEGDAVYATSASLPVTIAVNALASTNTEVYSTSFNVTVGQPVTISAKVREILVGGNTTRTIPAGPNGNVTFRDGSTILGTIAISSTSGIASMTLTNLSGGVHNITASYEGNSSYAASDSLAVRIVAVAATRPATNTAAYANAFDVVAGEPVTISAMVRELVAITSGQPAPDNTATAIPTGNVTFRDGATVLGTVALGTANGIASLTVSNLSGGTHEVTASYEGNDTFQPSDSLALRIAVTASRPATNTEVYSTAVDVAAGQPVTISAKVREILGASDTRVVPGGPSGNVTFRDGTTVLGTVAIGGTSGIASITLSNLSGGVHNVTASYAGNASYQSSDSLSVRIAVAANRSATNTEVYSTASTPTGGQPVTISAKVREIVGGSGTRVVPGGPTGNVTFRDGTTVLGTVAISTTTGIASLTINTLSRNVHGITASYEGSAVYTASASPAIYITVRGIDATAKLSAEGRSGTATLTAVVAPRDAASGVATGRVAFYDVTPGGPAASPLARLLLGTVDVVDGRAVWSGATVSGARRFQAAFTGTGFFNNTSTPIVNASIRYPVAIALIGTPAGPWSASLSVTVTPLTPGAPAASGRVTFYDGTTRLAVATVVNGVAQLTVNSTGPMKHSYTAVFQGGDLFESITSLPTLV